MDPYQLFHEGKLDEAIDAAIQVVKSKPTELAYRTFLFELLAFKGELERAEKQLDVIGKQHVESEWGAKVYANLLEAERKRRSLFAHGRRPEFFDDPPEYVEDHLKALDFAREGQDDEAAKLLAAAAEKRPVIKVKRGDQEVEGIQDCDDILAPVFEIYILADYCWVPYDSIKELEISPPERPRDLMWAAVRFITLDDTQRRGYMPVRYNGSESSDDVQLQLGRATDWSGPETGPIRGIGHRLLLVGEDAIGPMDLGEVQIAVG